MVPTRTTLPPIPAQDHRGSAAGPEALFTPDDIVRIQDAGVSRTVAHAFAKSPFYRRHLAEAGVLPADVRSVTDLRGLPVTTKQDVSEAGRDLWCVARDRVIDIATTSGTTGTPTLYPLTQVDLERLGHNENLCFTCAGVTRNDVALLAVTIDKCFMAGLAYFEGLRRIGATTIRVGTGSPGMLLGMLQRMNGSVIVSVPSFLKKIAMYATERGIDLAALSARRLVCIGEPVRDEQLRLTPLAESLARAFGARVLSTYGITELASSLCECQAECGGHLHPELLHIEILDELGQPVPDGAVGEIVATTIGVEAMPLVRFRTGDLSYLMRERCACGLWTPRIGPILGRKNQMMKIKGTTVYPAAVQRALDAMDEVVEYVMIATSPSRLSDELEVVAVCREDEGACVRRIRERLAAELRVTPIVRAARSEEVRRLRDSAELRKNRLFLDRRGGPC